MSKSQFKDGLEMIHRAIILGVEDVGGPDIGINNFRWNHGKRFGPGHAPDAVALEIVMTGPSVPKRPSRGRR
jgi:hypothetical protein